MSRIGKKPIALPDKVKVSIEGRSISAEGPKGRLQWTVPDGIEVESKDREVLVRKSAEGKIYEARHGLARAYINNMIKGVTEGFVKQLEIHGVGYRAQVQGRRVELQLGFSHPVIYEAPDGITVKTPKPNQIMVEGIDRAAVGEVAAELREYFKPEPYKGKGIRYSGEYVRKKAGKAVA